MTRPRRINQYEKGLRGLRALILEGAYPMGSRLREVAVAERLEISRTPLRQAMTALVDEGLLEKIETGGCRVVRFSMADIVDAIEIRGVMEGTAARLAAERGADPDVLGECAGTLAALDVVVADLEGFDFEAYVRLNAAFHDQIARMSGSTIIAREVERAARQPLASPSAFLQGQDLMPDFRRSLITAQQHHRAMFEAIENREGARADAIAREHARLARRNLSYVTEKKSEFVDRVPGLALVAT